MESVADFRPHNVFLHGNGLRMTQEGPGYVQKQSFVWGPSRIGFELLQ